MRRFIVNNWVFAPKSSIYFLNFTIFDPVPNSGGVHFKIAKWVRIWVADQYTKLAHPFYRVFQILLLIYTINFKCDDFKWRKSSHWNFNFHNFSSVPNSGSVYFQITKRSRIWFGDQFTNLEYHLCSVSKISHLIYKVNIK